MNGYDSANLIYLIGFLALLLFWLVPMIRQEGFGRVAKMSLGWIGIFGLITLLAIEWPRIRGALDPAGGRVMGEEFRVQPRNDGHYYIRGTVNGIDTTFLVDTGATDVVLTMETARRAGWTEDRLVFDGMAATANGLVPIAAAQIETMTVGPITVKNQSVSVNSGALDANLLGMSFLRELSGWRVEEGELVLSP